MPPPHSSSAVYGPGDPLDIAIDKYNNHPRIQLIKQNVTARNKIIFRQVLLEEVLTQFRDLNPTKSSPLGSIPVKILTEHF